MKAFTITADTVGEEREAARSLLQMARVPALLSGLDAGVYGFTHAGLDLLECLENGLAVLLVTVKHVRNLLAEHPPTASRLEEMQPFAHLYGLYVASELIVDTIKHPGGARVRVDGTFALGDIRRLIGTDRFAFEMLSDYVRYLSFYRGHGNPEKRSDCEGGPARATSAYFQLMSGALRALAKDAAWVLPLDAMRSARLSVFGRSFDGFQWTVEDQDSGSGLLDVHMEDIIGNEDFIKAGIRLARDVAGFDFESKQNAKRLNPVLFAMGDPGCGKTVTCHAIGNYFLQFCKARGIAAKFLVIRRSDWASSYQNASANQLVDIFKTQVAAFPGVVGVYWPDIDTAFAAREDPGVRSEEKNILGAVFGIFDGTIIPKNGQWFMLCDANTLNMDRAAISRITQDPFTLRGPVSPEHFIEMTRDKKLRQYRDFLPPDAEWDRFGARCIEWKLTGRSIENVTRKVVSEIEDFEYPDEYFTAPLERRREILKSCSNPISMDRLMTILEHYRQFEQEAEERAYSQRFKDRVQEIVFNLSAQAAAIETARPAESRPR